MRWLLIYLLIFLSGCAVKEQPHTLSYVIVGGNSQSIRFDVNKDKNIDSNDPRIKAIVLVSRQNSTAQIHIAYSSYEGGLLADKVAKSLLVYKVTVLTPEHSGILVNNQFKEDKVLVYTHFDSLLKN